MKSLYLKINTVQNSILASMLDPGDSAWMSLSSKGNIDNIKQLMLSIDSLLKDEFAAAFIRTDLGDLKKEYNAKEPGKQMTDFWFKLRSLHGPLSEAGAAKAVAHVQGRQTRIVERLPASLASQAALERGQGGLAAQNDKIPPAMKTDDGNAHASLMKVI